MTYYILMPGDSEKDTRFSTNILGEESFGVFYAEDGMRGLNTLINKHPDLLSKIIIKDERGKDYTLTEFFDHLGKLRIKKRNF